MSASDINQACVLHGCTLGRRSRFICGRHYDQARRAGVLGRFPKSWPYGGKGGDPSGKDIRSVMRLLGMERELAEYDGVDLAPAPPAAPAPPPPLVEAEEVPPVRVPELAPTLPPLPEATESAADGLRRTVDELRHELSGAEERVRLKDDELNSAETARGDAEREASATTRELERVRGVARAHEQDLTMEKRTTKELRAELADTQAALQTARDEHEAWRTVRTDSVSAVEAERDQAREAAERIGLKAAEHLSDLREARADLATVGARTEELEHELAGVRQRLARAIQRRNSDVRQAWNEAVDMHTVACGLHGLTDRGLHEILGAIGMARAVGTRIVMGDGPDSLLHTVFDELRDAVESLSDEVGDLEPRPLMREPSPMAAPEGLGQPMRLTFTAKVDDVSVSGLKAFLEEGAEAKPATAAPEPAPSVDQVLRALDLVGLRVTRELVRGFSNLQRREAAAWAAAQLDHLVVVTDPPPAPAMPPWLALVHSQTPQADAAEDAA